VARPSQPFGGLLTSDRWWGYNWVTLLRRQVCWAHLRRVVVGGAFFIVSASLAAKGRCTVLSDKCARFVVGGSKHCQITIMGFCGESCLNEETQEGYYIGACINKGAQGRVRCQNPEPEEEDCGNYPGDICSGSPADDWACGGVYKPCPNCECPCDWGLDATWPCTAINQCIP
jgi:hypothetical protein